jgi:radical SAM protein with 4Fe4S-binding SPASM domain
MTTAECLDVVAQLADLDCALLTLSGGEPTLRPDWLDIARAARRRGLVVNVVSNGIALTLDTALRIKDAGLANVGLSLDGLPNTHEALRGPETFSKLAAAVGNLRRAGVVVSIMTTLNRQTAVELEQIHDLAVDLGAGGWRVQLAKPMGNLAEKNDFVIPPLSLLDIVPRLARIKKNSPIWVDVGDSIGYYGPHEKLLRQTRWPKMSNVWAGCQAGRRAVGIESDGGVKGCLSLQASLEGHRDSDPFREGNLRSRRLADIWFDPQAFAYNRHQTLADLTGECKRCRYARRCRGGAKCVAAAATGRLGEDPFCYHRVAVQAARQAPDRATRPRLAQKAAAAALSVGLGLGGACLGGALTSGCADRAIGNDEWERQAVDAGVTEPDADQEPPVAEDYGVIMPYDAAVVPSDGGEVDAEPPNHMDYGVFPQVDAGFEAIDAEVPMQPDYGDIPPEPEPDPLPEPDPEY